MTTHHKTICVYCSSSTKLVDVYYEAASELGRLIASRGDTLIYGGGKQGLMGAVARGATSQEGRIVSVIPEKLMPQLYDGSHEVIVTGDMRERKAVMGARADAFVALPGGFGTLDELLETLTLKQLLYHDKAIILVNTLGYFDALVGLFEQSYDQQFASPAFRQLYHVAETAADAMAYLDAYQPNAFAEKWLEEKLGGRERQ